MNKKYGRSIRSYIYIKPVKLIKFNTVNKIKYYTVKKDKF